MELLKVRKIIIVLFIATAIIGLTACGDSTDNQYLPEQTTAIEQEVEETYVADDNEDTNADTNKIQGIHTQTPPSGEIIAGTVLAVDEMSITIDTSSVFVANETGQHISTGEPQEPQHKIIHVTEQTIIEVQTLAGGQIIGTTAGTLDDLSIQALVMAEGEWHGDEFVATALTIMNF